MPSLSVQTASRAQSGVTSAASSLDFDLQTGTLKFGGTAFVAKQDEEPFRTTGRATTSNSFDLRETFVASGSGTVTFSVAVDGFLQAQDDEGFGLSTNASLDMLLSLTSFSGGSDRDRRVIDLDDLSLNSTLIDEVLTATVSIADGFRLSLQLKGSYHATAFSQLPREMLSEANFLNTAFLSFETSDGLSLLASDAGFLSQQGGDTTTPVPLPAGLPLLLAGFGALGVMQRRR